LQKIRDDAAAEQKRKPKKPRPPDVVAFNSDTNIALLSLTEPAGRRPGAAGRATRNRRMAQATAVGGDLGAVQELNARERQKLVDDAAADDARAKKEAADRLADFMGDIQDRARSAVRSASGDGDGRRARRRTPDRNREGSRRRSGRRRAP
jgi:hypothetical protein